MATEGEFRHPSHAHLSAAAPEFFERYDAVVRSALALDGDAGLALPAKYRELIVICMLAQLRASEEAIAGHLARAFDAGLTEAEFTEGAQAAYVPGGSPVLMHLIRSLTFYQQQAERDAMPDLSAGDSA
jgi:alkylhydroperoxidase/carboxymuconolactone decarboxylase family protein YurZ